MSKFSLFLISLLLTNSLYAKEADCLPPVKPVYKAKQKPIVQVVEKIIESPKEPCCTNESLEVKNQATTGSQNITINVPEQKVITRVIVKEKTVVQYKTKKIKVYNPNRLQLLLGVSKTKLEVEQDICCNYSAKKVYEQDVGLQYLRDFGSFTGSLMGSSNKNMYLGFGINW